MKKLSAFLAMVFIFALSLCGTAMAETSDASGNYTYVINEDGTACATTSVHNAALPGVGTVVEWIPYSSAVLHEGENYVYLTSNLTDSISIAAGQTVYLDLQGYSISSSNALSVANGGRLILCDYVGGGKIKPNGTSTGCSGIRVNEGGQADMYGGIITGYDAYESYSYQGGVNVGKNAVFNMYAGTITGNKAYSGGGIYSYYGNVNIYGGTISGNESSGEGGGIYSYRGNLLIAGGTISGNTSYNEGGGVYFGKGYRYEPYTFTMLGGEIKDNITTYRSGAGVYVYYSDMTLSGGSITGNTLKYAGRMGAGIYGSNAGIIVSGSPVVTGNKASTGAASNLYYALVTIKDSFSGSIGISADAAYDSVSNALIKKDGGGLAMDDLTGFVPDNADQTFYINESDSAVLGWKQYYLSLTNAKMDSGAAYGNIAPGTQVLIHAVIPEGKVFSSWSYPEGTIAEENGASITVTMPISSLRVSALLVDEIVISDGLMTDYNGEDTDVITLPDGVTDIAEDAFDGYENLDTVIINSSDTQSFTGNLPDGIKGLFVQDGVLYGCINSGEEVTLPETVTSIDGCVFPEGTVSISGPAVTSALLGPCDTLKNISFPAMEEVGENAFRDFTSLEQVDLPSALIIGDNAFSGCSSLSGINIPKVQSVGDNAFSGCSSLTQVTLPDSLTDIGASAFDKTVLIRSSVDAYAREWAKTNGNEWEHDNHTEDILPSEDPTCTQTGLTEGKHCQACGKVLTAQTVVPALGHSISADKSVYEASIGEEIKICADIMCGHDIALAADWVCENADVADLTGYTPADDGAAFIELTFEASAAGVTRVIAAFTDGSPAQELCTIVVHSAATMNLPASLKNIKEEAFAYSCAEEFVLPEGVKTIGARAFADSKDLLLINLPDSIETIADSAFNGCDNLVIICTEGSVGHLHAQAKNIPHITFPAEK